MSNDYSVRTVVTGLKESLSAYLRAQYHIRDEALVRERSQLFDETGVIAQEPFVEATPSYATVGNIDAINIPYAAKRLLNEIAALEIGIPRTPYKHQAQALEAFMGVPPFDVIASTGTGSGKTEIFVLNILASLAIEAEERRSGLTLPGCRALILYPMNALVTDQLSRIRRILGNLRVADALQGRFGRRVRFGMYTSRTPFPGEFSGVKCAVHIKPLFEKFYLPFEAQPMFKQQLVEKGRWPCKDLLAFYNEHEREWLRRLRTQPNDTELFMRHEMQQQCPDLLITNYSMLEYMMLRPIERNIFQQTREWLHSDTRNSLILVLDEAHMYRGTGGAEVAMLIRRLLARLRIPRERLRCILTSASMGSSEDAQAKAIRFAADLTGLSSQSTLKFRLITGTLESIGVSRVGTNAEADALAGFNLGAFQRFGENLGGALDAIHSVANSLHWPHENCTASTLPNWLFDQLKATPVANELVALATKGATKFSALAKQLFPETETNLAANATQALLALANFARSATNNKVFLPTRLHLFFRGVQGLYVCLNRNCTSRKLSNTDTRLGAIWTEPRVQCECGHRVYELLTHRDCGVHFIRGFVQPRPDADFLFHEKESNVGSLVTGFQGRLREIHLLLRDEPHPEEMGNVQPLWIDALSGRLLFEPPGDPNGFIRAWQAITSTTDVLQPHSFDSCPVCLKSWRSGLSKIMDLRTKGEQPFAALVKAQTFLQPPTRPDRNNFPNQGRKVLLFSDGRQKAARLARDVPREVENDSFRECLALAVQTLRSTNREAILADRQMYLPFLDVVSRFNLSFFDGFDQHALKSHVQEYRREYDGDIAQAFDHWLQATPPSRFYQALVRQICSAYYSIPFVTVGWLEPASRNLRQLQAKLQQGGVPVSVEFLGDLLVLWIADLASEYAVNEIPNATLASAAGYSRDDWGSRAQFSSVQRRIIGASFSEEQLTALNNTFIEGFCVRAQSGTQKLNRNKIVLRIDPDATWYECRDCFNLHPRMLMGRCPSCGLLNISPIDPNNNAYIESRKGLWRNPIRECLAGIREPRNVTAEEHTAQLSFRDTGSVLATTEQHELLFQDIVLSPQAESPVDVLSCTTTMEVGVDIGSLVAVGLRNVPPQRENYQQRAGRAGRRGSAVSSVVTYCQGGPHDNHYFQNVAAIVSGAPRLPNITIDNAKIVRRHVHAFLIQHYFLTFPGTGSGVLSSALGLTADFFSSSDSQPCIATFKRWVEEEVIGAGGGLIRDIAAWVPNTVATDVQRWIKDVAKDFVAILEGEGTSFMDRFHAVSGNDAGENEDDDSRFLEFLFARGLLPTYAFPTDLCSFCVERSDPQSRRVQVVEKPQQAISKALTEYAPGRLVVIDKRTYRSVAVTANVPATEIDRAAPLFRGESLAHYAFCTNPLCSFVQESIVGEEAQHSCPLCGTPIRRGEILQPEVFLPDRGRSVDELDTDQDITFASPAQFPIPIRQQDENWQQLGTNCVKTFAEDRDLLIVNKGDPDELRGFLVCDKCGRAQINNGNPPATHSRPYETTVRRSPGATGPPQQCDGTMRSVLLGNAFKSDLMVLRIIVRTPLETVANPGLPAFMAMQSGLQTLAEALKLAASRRFDIDASEFSSGFRLFPTSESGQLVAEIYLFDTLSGGAGYSNWVGEELSDVLADVHTLLNSCTCERACYNCLRNYGNQFVHTQLDRELGLQVLNYALASALPEMGNQIHQQRLLSPLRRFLEFSGVATISPTELQIPLAVEKNGRRLALGTAHGLFSEAATQDHPLHAIVRAERIPVFVINEYFLTRNLPAVHRLILDRLG